VLLLFCFVWFVSLPFQLLSQEENRGFKEHIGSLLDNLYNSGKFSGTVKLSHNGNTVFEKALGYSNIESSIPNTMETQYSLASLGKLFTEVTILQLVENGKLDLDDTLDTYKINFSDKRAEDITVRQLLSHRSGFGHYWDNEAFLSKKMELKNVIGYMEFVRKIPLDFDPGTDYQYSNIGYVLLGRIIELITKKDFYDYIKSSIFKPLKMTSSNYNFQDNLTDNYALPYTRGKDEKLIKVDTLFSLRGASDGGGYSTVSDLSIFLNEIFNNNLLSDESISLLVSDYKVDTLPREEWLYDIQGGIDGVSTLAAYHGPSGYSLIALGNMDPPSSELVMLGILEILEQYHQEGTKTENSDLDIYPLNGYIMDGTNNRPIPYVNIGIEDKTLGTASKEDGYFELDIPREFSSLELTFSALGYEKIRIPIIELHNDQDRNIVLYEKVERLSGITLMADAPKLKMAGNKNLGMFTSGAYIGGGNPGASLITKIKVPSDYNKVQKVKIHMRDNPKRKEFKLRLRLLEFDEEQGTPGTDILNKSIIVTSHMVKGWITFDLTGRGIIVEKDFLVGIEWIEEKDKLLSAREAYPRISYVGSKNSKTFARLTSLAPWKPIAIKPIVYVELLTK
jgi:CubicO group peptidase (beta-lactamase class C family)